MKKFLSFLAIGTLFSTVEEFLTVVVLRGDLGAYFFTLLILFPAFLTFMFFSSRGVDRLFKSEPARELTHLIMGGLIGLAIEWFVIGLSPWSDPDANPVVMLVFQLGMFSFWSTVGFAPRLFLNPGELSRRTRKAMLIFCLPYLLFTYFIALTIPETSKFIAIIALIVFGYLFLNLFYLLYFMRSFSRLRPAAA
jgi:hypothetical protein